MRSGRVLLISPLHNLMDYLFRLVEKMESFLCTDVQTNQTRLHYFFIFLFFYFKFRNVKCIAPLSHPCCSHLGSKKIVFLLPLWSSSLTSEFIVEIFIRLSTGCWRVLFCFFSWDGLCLHLSTSTAQEVVCRLRWQSEHIQNTDADVFHLHP